MGEVDTPSRAQAGHDGRKGSFRMDIELVGEDVGWWEWREGLQMGLSAHRANVGQGVAKFDLPAVPRLWAFGGGAISREARDTLVNLSTILPIHTAHKI